MNYNMIPPVAPESLTLCKYSACKGCAATANACLNLRKLTPRAKRNTLVKIASLLLLHACFLLSGQAKAEQNEQASTGYLMVFSSTQQTEWGEGSYYYVHTGYRIYDSAGKAVKWIENHGSTTDETPEKIELAPGKYTISAQSDKEGQVRVPVVIKTGRTTTVQLENGNA